MLNQLAQFGQCTDRKHCMILRLIWILFLFFSLLQSFVGAPVIWSAVARLRSPFSEPEAQTPGTDTHTMRTSKQLFYFFFVWNHVAFQVVHKQSKSKNKRSPCPPALFLLSTLSFWHCWHSSGTWKTSLLCLPDKTLVRAVVSGQALLLLHHRIAAGAAGPHHIQHLQGTQKYGHLWWRQLHSVSHPVDRNMWVHHTSLAGNRHLWGKKIMWFRLSMWAWLRFVTLDFSYTHRHTQTELCLAVFGNVGLVRCVFTDSKLQNESWKYDTLAWWFVLCSVLHLLHHPRCAAGESAGAGGVCAQHLGADDSIGGQLLCAWAKGQGGASGRSPSAGQPEMTPQRERELMGKS